MALCNVKDGNIGQAMEEAQASGVDAWAYYQAKGTKMNIAESARDTLVLQREIAPSMSPEARALVDKKIADYDAKMRVYEKEKAEIKKSAEDYKKEYERLNLHDDQFDMADALMSVAIALLGITALTRKRRLHVPRLGVRGLRRGDGHRRLRRPRPAPRLPRPHLQLTVDDHLFVSTLAAAVAAAAAAAPAYVREIETWRRERLQRLTADGGWLTVAGLVLAEDGREHGSAPTPPTTSCFPRIRRRPQAGTFVLEKGRVRVEVRPGVAVTLAGKPVTGAGLRSDAGGATPDVLSLGALTMQIIDRGGRLGVRLKDMKSPARAKFKGLRYFPIDPRYRVVATFVPNAKPVSINVPNVLGTVESMPSPGTASFTIAGVPAAQPLRLDAVLEPGETQLFFIFRDPTAGKTTYGAGRFLYADPPVDGKVVLDFNRAYSPPCAFTASRDVPDAARQQQAAGGDRGGRDVRRPLRTRPLTLTACPRCRFAGQGGLALRERAGRGGGGRRSSRR